MATREQLNYLAELRRQKRRGGPYCALFETQGATISVRYAWRAIGELLASLPSSETVVSNALNQEIANEYENARAQLREGNQRIYDLLTKTLSGSQGLLDPFTLRPINFNRGFILPVPNSVKRIKIDRVSANFVRDYVETHVVPNTFVTCYYSWNARSFYIELATHTSALPTRAQIGLNNAYDINAQKLLVAIEDNDTVRWTAGRNSSLSFAKAHTKMASDHESNWPIFEKAHQVQDYEQWINNVQSSILRMPALTSSANAANNKTSINLAN